MSATGDPPSPGVEPQDDLSESHQAGLICCAVITWAIAALFVALRFYTRRWLLHLLGTEDWVILVSLVFSALMSAFIVAEVSYGFGLRIETFDFSKTNFIEMSKLAWVDVIWYDMTIFLTKLSILLLYRRILTYQHALYAVHILMVIVIVTTLFALCITMTACIPLKAWWDYTIPAGTASCHPPSFWWAAVGLHMSTDVFIFALPMPIIFSLRVCRRQKLILYGLCAFGFLTTIMSGVRLIYLVQQYIVPDFTYDNAALTYWTCIEVNTAIVCSCVMTLRPLLNRIFPNSFLSGPGSGDKDHRSPGMDNGGGLNRAPLTIGSMPVRKQGHDRRQPSWTTFQTDDVTRVTGDVEEALELISRARTMETGLYKTIGLPTGPVKAQQTDETARSPVVGVQKGQGVRPTSVRWSTA